MKINFSKLVILLTILHIDLFVAGLFILNLDSLFILSPINILYLY